MFWNGIKCYEIELNVIKWNKMLWNRIKCYEIEMNEIVCYGMKC